jgi:hypothetical protein
MAQFGSSDSGASLGDILGAALREKQAEGDDDETDDAPAADEPVAEVAAEPEAAPEAEAETAPESEAAPEAEAEAAAEPEVAEEAAPAEDGDAKKS